MLPPFHIRNLWPSSLPNPSQDTLVQINVPCYDETILSHPLATLKYYDPDDGDLITVGSSPVAVYALGLKPIHSLGLPEN